MIKMIGSPTIIEKVTKIEKNFSSILSVLDEENDIEYIGKHLNIEIKVGSTLKVFTKIEKKNLKSISSFFIYQFTENWKEIQVSENEIFFNGKFTNTIPIVKKKENFNFLSKFPSRMLIHLIIN